MACYNNECCAYDSLGNPTMYRCHNLEWTKVRKLARFDANTFEYNAEGIRFKKNNNVYTLDGDRILKETDGTNTTTYYYANVNAPIGFNYNGTDYYFCKNIQGDVIAIYDADGDIVAKYVYDAWGNHKIYDANNNEVTSTTHIGYINPIRYRGYYFDVETGLYYLQTRYYDPETGRFLNSDAIEYLAPEQLGGLNLYAYCNNNPVIFIDHQGTKTNSIGFSFSFGGLGSGYSISIFLSMDSNGMCAFQWSYSVPKDENTRNTELGVNVGACWFWQQTNLDSVEDLVEESKAAGIAGGPIGVDIITNQENEVIGNQVAIGVGISATAHVNETYTTTIGNPFQSLFSWIKGWFS